VSTGRVDEKGGARLKRVGDNAVHGGRANSLTFSRVDASLKRMLIPESSIKSRDTS